MENGDLLPPPGVGTAMGHGWGTFSTKMSRVGQGAGGGEWRKSLAEQAMNFQRERMSHFLQKLGHFGTSADRGMLHATVSLKNVAVCCLDFCTFFSPLRSK